MIKRLVLSFSAVVVQLMLIIMVHPPPHHYHGRCHHCAVGVAAAAASADSAASVLGSGPGGDKQFPTCLELAIDRFDYEGRIVPGRPPNASCDIGIERIWTPSDLHKTIR